MKFFRRLLVLWLALFAYAAPAWAQKSVSATTAVHIIHRNADATAFTVHVAQGIRPNLGASLELTRISEDSSKIDLAAYRMALRLGRMDQPQLWGFAGIRYVRGSNPIFGDFDEVAPQVGLSSSLALPRDIRLDASAGFSFFDKTLTELQAAISHEIRDNLLVSAGYKSYVVSGDSISGPMLALTWRR